MKRKAVLDKLKAEASARGLSFSTSELKNHTGVTVGGHRSTLGRHAEIDDVTAHKFWDQFAEVFEKGWWR